MPRRPHAFARAVPVILVGLTCLTAGCSDGGGGGSSSGLMTALSRVADTAGNRSQIWYDDTAGLGSVAGSHPLSATGFGGLRGLGAATLAGMAEVLPGDTGISVLTEDYSVSAGNPPQNVTLLAGGQNSAQVTGKLSRLGWKKSGGTLIAPSLASAGTYAVALSRVRASGSDVAIGGMGADLRQIGTPSGPALAGDPGISALAQCLGDVVSAAIFTGGQLGDANPLAVATGVSRPASSTTVPHIVVCVAWSTQAGADKYASQVRQALASGVAAESLERYATLLPHASVTTPGGSEHLVQWQADTPRSASLIFEMVQNDDLPALPDCGRIPRAARARIIGCS